jgi:hypothetical protein
METSERHRGIRCAGNRCCDKTLLVSQKQQVVRCPRVTPSEHKKVGWPLIRGRDLVEASAR